MPSTKTHSLHLTSTQYPIDLNVKIVSEQAVDVGETAENISKDSETKKNKSKKRKLASTEVTIDTNTDTQEVNQPVSVPLTSSQDNLPNTDAQVATTTEVNPSVSVPLASSQDNLSNINIFNINILSGAAILSLPKENLVKLTYTSLLNAMIKKRDEAIILRDHFVGMGYIGLESYVLSHGLFNPPNSSLQTVENHLNHITADSQEPLVSSIRYLAMVNDIFNHGVWLIKAGFQIARKLQRHTGVTPTASDILLEGYAIGAPMVFARHVSALEANINSIMSITNID